MMNRKWLLIASLVLALTMSLTGTLAYLTDTDSDVNVMTLGNVDIQQLENGSDNGFSQGAPLYPAHYKADTYAEGMDVTGAVAKTVTVKNLGPSDAFIRTVFAFEAGSLSAADYLGMIHLDADTDLVWTGEPVVIDDETYYLAYSVYPDAVKAGKETDASLTRIVMDKKADNDLVASFGGEYKIYVTSQAVQVTNLESLKAAGALEEAFGKIKSDNNPWVGDNAVNPSEPDLLISTVADLKAFANAVNAGNDFSGKVVALGTDLDLGNTAWTPIGVSGAPFEGIFDGQGNSISNFNVDSAENAGFFGVIRSAQIKNLIVKNADISGNHWVGGIVGKGVCGRILNCSVVNSTITCSIEQVNGGWDNGDKVGGIVGYLTADGGSGNVTGYVRDCSVTNTTVTGYRQLGGVVGYAQSTTDIAEVSGCTLFAVTVTQNLGTAEQNYKNLTAGQLKGVVCGDKSAKTIDENHVVTEGMLLSTAADLFAFAKAVNEGGKNFSGQIIVLANDIDLANQDWEPVGQTGKTQFMGTFDGQGYTIKNLSVDSAAETGKHYSSGLFGWLNHATVKNVKVDGATVVGNHNVAVIAGYLEASGCTVSNCHVVNASVTAKHANADACGDKVGVIVGHAGNSGVKVADCSAADSTVVAGRDAGQVVGAALTANVTGCSASNVSVTAGGDCTGANVKNDIIGRVL